MLAEINTRPLDLATSCYCLTSRAFVSDIFYVLEQAHTGRVVWPYAYLRDRRKYMLDLEKRFGGKPTDLFLGPAFFDDMKNIKMIDWVNEQVQRFLNTREGVFYGDD